MRWTISLAMALVFAGTAAGQSQPDSQGLEGIRGEIRQLRQDLRTLIGTAQRAQILVSRLQAEESVIKSLQDRIDSARSKLTQIQSEEKNLAFEVKRNEGLLGDIDNPAKRKETEEVLARFKVALEQRTNAEQETQTRLTDSEEQLRIEQAKLGRLQDELDRLDKTLQDSPVSK